MSVPIASCMLEKQLCSECKMYLTVGPVKVYPNRQVRCGRCVKENDNGVESKLFSIVTKNLVFPCINSFEGCSEEFSIQEMKSHEEVCITDAFTCPICDNFKGSSWTLAAHCQQFHKNEELKVMGFHIDLDQGFSQAVYFYCKGKTLLFINYKFEVDLNQIIVDVSRPGDKYKGDVMQILSLYTIDRRLLYKTQEHSCSKLNSIDNCGFTINMSQLNFMKNIVFCELDLIKKPVFSLGAKTLVMGPLKDSFRVRCNFSNISKLAEKQELYFPAVYYCLGIPWKFFMNVRHNTVYINLHWANTNIKHNSQIDHCYADVSYIVLSSIKKDLYEEGYSRNIKFNKFENMWVFYLKKYYIRNDFIDIEFKVNIYTDHKINKCKDTCPVHCQC